MCPNNACIVSAMPALINTKTPFPQRATSSYESPHVAGINISVWLREFLCGVHMFLLRVRASSECRINFVIGLLTPERALLHYKYSKRNTPETEDCCSRDLLQLLVAQPTQLIMSFWSWPHCWCCSILPQGSQAQWVSGGHWRAAWGNGAYWLCHIVGHCFYPTELCLFIGPQHQGLLVTQIKGQLRRWNSREIKVDYWRRSHSGELSTFIKQQ